MVQVMEEGEKLSKKQLTQETTIRKLRGQIREIEAEQSKVVPKSDHVPFVQPMKSRDESAELACLAAFGNAHMVHMPAMGV